MFAGSDACVTPVLSFAEVETEPHNTERDTFYNEDDSLLPDAGPAVLPHPARQAHPAAACRAPTPTPFSRLGLTV